MLRPRPGARPTISRTTVAVNRSVRTLLVPDMIDAVHLARGNRRLPAQVYTLRGTGTIQNRKRGYPAMCH